METNNNESIIDFENKLSDMNKKLNDKKSE